MMVQHEKRSNLDRFELEKDEDEDDDAVLLLLLYMLIAWLVLPPLLYLSQHLHPRSRTYSAAAQVKSSCFSCFVSLFSTITIVCFSLIFLPSSRVS